jgi:hypothetical protein
MFMRFMCCDQNGIPNGIRICLNIRKIENITQMGQWTAVPNPNIDEELFFDPATMINPFNAPPVRRAARPQRPVARVQQPDNFVVTPNAVSIYTMQQTYTVQADFDGLSKTLESLSNMYEET